MARIWSGSIIVAACVLSAGCMTSYNSSPNSFSGGVGAEPLAQDVYRVTVAGNAYLSSASAHEMLDLKSAETALENGYRYYAPEKLSDESMRSRHYGVFRNGVLMGEERVGSDKPRYVQTIHVLNESGAREHRSSGIEVVNAVFVYNELAPRVIGRDAPSAEQLLQGGKP